MVKVANVENCGNTAIVSFTVSETDGNLDYYIQSDGKTKLRKCVDPQPNVYPLPWGVSVCI